MRGRLMQGSVRSGSRRDRKCDSVALPGCWRRSISTASHNSTHRLDQLPRIVADAVFENRLDFLNVGDIFRRVAFDHDQIGLLAGRDGPDTIEVSEELCTVVGCNVDRFYRRESGLDQREVELLVESGFTPVEAIHIATYNGAQFLGDLDRIGTIAAGKQADLVVIKGDPSKDISDIEKVETVFKDGIGYDSAKLIESVRGMVGSR